SFDKAIEIKPDLYQAWNNRGAALEKLGKYQEAIFSYDKALEIQPDDQIAIENRRLLLEKLENSAP
ncbi:MAG: tetratricopeptide repeat protein, partial [Spirulinaceae cyanobacterium]